MFWKTWIKRGIVVVGITMIAAAGSYYVINYVANTEIPTSVVIAEGDIGQTSTLLEEEYFSKNTRELIYESLTDEQMKEIYVIVRDCIINYETSVEVPGASRTDINNILYAVMGDHPEIFWLGGYEFNVGVFTPIYSVTENQKTALEREIRLQTASIINEAVYANRPNDFEKAMLIYDYIVKNTVYAESDRDQEIDSVILNQESVCSGYAKAFAYLMDRMNIPCACIYSDTHMYNVVELEGVKYIVDVTGGDNFEIAGVGNYTDYSYLICSSGELKNISEYQPIGICESLQYSCTDTGRNYYTEYGIYVESWTENCFVEMEECLSGSNVTSIKCSETEVFEIAQGEITEYFTDEDMLIVTNQALRTITVIRK